MKQSKYLKEESKITDEYIKKLRDYILKNQKDFFCKENEANHWRDFEYFKTINTDREHLIMPKEVMLVDRSIDSEHCLVICKITGSIESGRPRVKHIANIINIDKLDNFRCGYFLLPII
jgi:hypothetical protein